jgi:hypothetical protein
MVVGLGNNVQAERISHIVGGACIVAIILISGLGADELRPNTLPNKIVKTGSNSIPTATAATSPNLEAVGRQASGLAPLGSKNREHRAGIFELSVVFVHKNEADEAREVRAKKEPHG